MIMKTNWEKAFKEEFGIHFKDSKGELQFALSFINDLLAHQKQEIVEKIEKLFKEKGYEKGTLYQYIKQNLTP